MIRKTLLAACLITIGGGLAGTAVSQGSKPFAVSAAKPAEMSGQLVVEARIDRLEKEVDALKSQVQTLCSAVGKQAMQLKKMQSSGDNDSVVMQPPQGIKGSCL